MKQYLELLEKILTEGADKQDRTGTGTLSCFGHQLRCDLSEGFPLLTTKKVHVKSIVYELLWFLRGETNVRWLQERGVTIWDEWADAEGELGPVYGAQWRQWRNRRRLLGRDEKGRFRSDKGGLPQLNEQMHEDLQQGLKVQQLQEREEIEASANYDQIKWLIEEIKNNPDSRRLLVSAWNPPALDEMALAPCHVMFQFYIVNNRLSCQLYQRSADVFLGVPFNIASYALLTHMVAMVTGYEVGEFVHTFGDVHLYKNHLEQAKQQLQREPRPLPTLALKPRDNLFEFEYEDIAFEKYDPDSAIRAPVAI